MRPHWFLVQILNDEHPPPISSESSAPSCISCNVDKISRKFLNATRNDRWDRCRWHALIVDNFKFKLKIGYALAYYIFKLFLYDFLQVGVDPCRFCGMDGHPLTRKGNSNIISCSCKDHDKGLESWWPWSAQRVHHERCMTAVRSTAHSVLHLCLDIHIQSGSITSRTLIY